MGNSQTQIFSELLAVGAVLKTDFRYKVPPYQRNFSWATDETTQLWDDLIEAIEEDRPEYFLGTVVVHENRDDKIRTIIDGQQRLACLSMLLAALRTIYAANGDERAAEVYSDYLGVRDRRTRVTEPRLTLNALNEPTFHRLVLEELSDAELIAEGTNASATSNQLLCASAKYFRDAIRARIGSGKYENTLLELEEYVRDRVVLILLRVGDEADAYLIFETLNDRGLELSISDLLKNYIFGKAGNKLSLVRKQWEEMSFLLGNQNETQFLRHYWLSKYGVVRERELYKAIKKKFSSQNAVLKLMTELRDSADKYAALSNVDHSIWKTYGTGVRRDLEYLQLFGLSQFRPLMLAALETLTEQEVAKVVRLVLVVSFRYSIIGSLGTGNIERAYSDAAISVRNGKANTPAKIFSELASIYPDDQRFASDFEQKVITKPKLARYILAQLANAVQGSRELVVLEDEKKVDLEHIMPKAKNAAWTGAAANDEEYLDHVNRLGNLTLVERSKNQAASTDGFDNKKSIAYAKSDIELTRSLASRKSWTVTQIANRQREMAQVAKTVWKLPY